MNKFIYFSKICSLSLLLLPVRSCAADSTPVYRIYNVDDKQYVEICTEKGCSIKNLPQTDFENPSIKLHDLDADKVPELIVTEGSANGAVNVCSLIFRINTIGEFEVIKTNENAQEMCNISFHNGKIVSSYRDAANWFDDVYYYKHGKLVLEMRDKNGEIRTLFNKEGKAINSFMIMNDSKKWFDREKLTASIKSEKAMLYNSPSLNDVSKMYLIKNDPVIIKDFQYSKNGSVLFYLIEYTNAKNVKIKKWVAEKSLTINR
jgi:hypothetical protein